MMHKDGSSGISRRKVLSGTVQVGASVLVASALPGSIARAQSKLSGQGSVVVGDGGGAWGAAKKAAYFEPFEAETGIKVVANPTAGWAKFRASLKVGAPSHDLYPISAAPFFASFVREDLLEPIDYSYWDQANKDAYVLPVHEYGVPGIFYALVLAYDRRKFTDNPPKNWKDFWDTESFPGPRTLGPGAWGPEAALFEQALLADGVTPAELYPLDFDRAFKSLDKIRPAVSKFWQSGAEPVQLLADGQVSLASAYNGRVSDLQSKGVPIGSTWNQSLVQNDYWGVAKGSPNAENAMKFLAFISRPEVQAKFASLIAYGQANSRAFEYISPERAQVLPGAPALRNQHIFMDLSWWAQETLSGKTNVQVAAERWEAWLTTAK